MTEWEMKYHMVNKAAADLSAGCARLQGERDALLDSRRADEALMREALEAIERACNTAMINTAKARVPECGDFCSIAQDLDWSCEALRAQLGGV
jgi:hypothetical protein